MNFVHFAKKMYSPFSTADMRTGNDRTNTTRDCYAIINRCIMSEKEDGLFKCLEQIMCWRHSSFKEIDIEPIPVKEQAKIRNVQLIKHLLRVLQKLFLQPGKSCPEVMCKGTHRPKWHTKINDVGECTTSAGILRHIVQGVCSKLPLLWTPGFFLNF